MTLGEAEKARDLVDRFKRKFGGQAGEAAPQDGGMNRRKTIAGRLRMDTPWSAFWDNFDDGASRDRSAIARLKITLYAPAGWSFSRNHREAHQFVVVGRERRKRFQVECVETDKPIPIDTRGDKNLRRALADVVKTVTGKETKIPRDLISDPDPNWQDRGFKMPDRARARVLL